MKPLAEGAVELSDLDQLNDVGKVVGAVAPDVAREFDVDQALEGLRSWRDTPRAALFS